MKNCIYIYHTDTADERYRVPNIETAIRAIMATESLLLTARGIAGLSSEWREWSAANPLPDHEYADYSGALGIYLDEIIDEIRRENDNRSKIIAAAIDHAAAVVAELRKEESSNE